MTFSETVTLSRSVLGRGVQSINAACALRTCGTRKIFSSLNRRGVGIMYGNLWFCSGECLSKAILTKLSARPRSSLTRMHRQPRFPIGLVLLSQGRITEDQLRLAMDRADSNGAEVESTLLHLGFVTEEEIAAARAAQWGYPVFTGGPSAAPVQPIPPTLLRTYSAVPLYSSPLSKRFLIGFVFRVEHSLLQCIEQITGWVTEACFITMSEYRYRMEQLTSESRLDEVVFDDYADAVEIAGTIQRFTEHIHAKELFVGECRDYYWSRVVGRRRTLDLLFQLDHGAANRTSIEIGPLDDRMSRVG